MNTLYPYQDAGAAFLASHDRALLADRMGLGKTIQAIEAARRIRSTSTLVVCPASVVPNWEAEWKAWDGPERVRFVSYSKLIREETAGYGPDLTILDEAHYCKNPTAKRTRVALGIAARSNYAWLLTGTPMPNDPTEVYPFFRFLWPERLEDLGIRTSDDWLHRFCLTRYTEYGEKPYAVQNGDLLRGMLNEVMLRRSLEDVGFELPPLRVDLDRLPRDTVDLDLEAYDAIEENDYTSRIRRVLGEAKAAPIVHRIEDELVGGEYDKVVVLYHHRSVGEALSRGFQQAGFAVTGFDGSTPQEERRNAIQRFQQSNVPVFLAQQTAAGVGITLTAAHEIVLVEPSWSPSDNYQAITRIHRIGQEHPCRARVFAVSGTLDEAVMGTIRQKLNMQAAIGLAGGT